MSKKTLLLIAGVAIMLTATTSAHAYYEQWDGWFNSGSLEYCEATFYYTNGSSELEDMTDGDVDEFFVSATDVSTFTCVSGDYAGWYIMLYPMASGWKDTGQNGHKEAEGDPYPTWTGKAFVHIPSNPTLEFDVWGTWDTGDEEDDMYFDYDPETPTYSAHWILSGSSPAAFTGGEGGSEGELINYWE